MIIRHDLELVFLHVPKCAGKEIRDLLLIGASADTSEELFNFAYSPILHRHVDLAHLPMADLVHWPHYRWLECYTVIAAVRNPYERLNSAANEYFRQRSREDEAIINGPGITEAMRRHYFSQLPLAHSQRDPRFIHSLPMTWFTHQGSTPKVDRLLRCEHLADDFQQLASELNLPAEMQAVAQATLRNRPLASEMPPSPSRLAQMEATMAHHLYAQDFATFGYPLHDTAAPAGATSGADADLEPMLEALCPGSLPSHAIPILERANQVEWHWGPRSSRQEAERLAATRSAR